MLYPFQLIGVYMKIAFIGHKGYPSLYGGVEKVVEEIANRLADKGHKCIVYSRKYYSSPFYDNKKIERVIVKGLKTRRLDTLTHTFVSLIDVLKRDVDVVAIHSFGNAVLNFIPRMFGIPVALHLHGFEWGQKRFNFIERNLLLRLPFLTLKRYSDAITTVSIEQHNELNKRNFENEYLPNGVEVNTEVGDNNELRNQKYILYVGRIAYQKGIEYLIKAFNDAAIAGFNLKIVGDHDHAEKYYNMLRSLADTNPSVEFLGYKYGEELNQLYKYAYTVVIPSESEECPMVLLESLAFHKCIIASKIPGIYNIAEDHVLYFESKNVAELRERLTEVCNSDEIRHECENRIINNKKMNQFNWDNIVDRYEKLYQDIILDKMLDKNGDIGKVSLNDIQFDRSEPDQIKLKVLDDLIQPFTFVHKTYYRFIRPTLPNNCRKQLQRVYKFNLNYKADFIDHAIHDLSKKNNGKPENNKYPDGCTHAIVLTHDVDTEEGFKNIPKIVEISQQHNLRSCWYLVPYLYKIDEGIIRLLREANDEIGIHGYNHDGKLFSSKKIFDERKTYINEAIKRFDAVGFRAPMVHRNILWISELDILYDSSSFDYDPFQPFPGGTGMIHPFRFKNILELPYTIPQDHTMFYELGQKNISIWINKINWLIKNHGVVLSITHPDYLISTERFAMYKDLLSFICSLKNSWHCLPNEITSWWLNKNSIKEIPTYENEKVPTPILSD